ncbi:MAG: glycosyltransferase family 2 protein [Chloroflexota bacterium]
MKELTNKNTVTSGELSQIIEAEINERPENCPPPADVAMPTRSATLPELTVAVCTRDNPQNLAHCLARLLALRRLETETPFQIIVVDNAPSTEETKALVASRPAIRYIREPRPGLNFARNRALQEATGELLAFIDDDVIVDRYWLRGLSWALARHPDAGAVTGLVLPSELETEAQILFEKRGGFEKSFETIRYGSSLPGHPFYPCIGGKFGTGCNMAFRRQVLLELGGFDEALDTGAPLPGGGDTDIFYRVVRAGYPLIYEPQFTVFHKHRRSYKQLKHQLARSWGQGLMAFVSKSYTKDPGQRSNLRRLVTWWFHSHLRDLWRSLRGCHELPPGIILAEIWGGLTGILGAYPRSVARVKRIRRLYSSPVRHTNITR